MRFRGNIVTKRCAVKLSYWWYSSMVVGLYRLTVVKFHFLVVYRNIVVLAVACVTTNHLNCIVLTCTDNLKGKSFLSWEFVSLILVWIVTRKLKLNYIEMKNYSNNYCYINTWVSVKYGSKLKYSLLDIYKESMIHISHLYSLENHKKIVLKLQPVK